MDIEDWRSEIDAIDMELIRLLNTRARLAVKVGALKRASGLPLCDPQREAEVLSNVMSANSGPLDDDALVGLFRQIINASRHAEGLTCEEALAESQEVAL